MGHMRSITDVKCTAPPPIKTQLPTISSQQTHQNIYDETKSRAVVLPDLQIALRSAQAAQSSDERREVYHYAF